MQFSTLLFAAALLVAGEPDTLDVATVTAEKGVTVSKRDTIIITGQTSVTDVLARMPGLQVTDMGGMAGLKTVSLRGLGTAHTAIFYDGVRIGNMQSGQGDLGMIGLEECAEAVVDYAQNSIDFVSARPQFRTDGNGNVRRIAGKASFKGGSFGTYLPSARLDWRISDRITMSVNASANISNGNFPYDAVSTADGSTTQARRTGNDMKQGRAGIALYGNMADGSWQAKAYFNTSDRGTPGSTSWPSEDRQKDRNAFVQGQMTQMFGRLYLLKASAKASYDDLEYISSWGDSRYRQKEVQLNTSHTFLIKDWLHASAAVRGQWDGLESGNYSLEGTGKTISRFTAEASGATSLALKWLKADIAVEYSGIADSGSGSSWHSVSPSANLRVTAFKGFDITAFGRRAYRTPMFNELYYAGYGNPDLKPEDAWLTDIGIDWNRTFCRRFGLTVRANTFRNWLSGKIISAPSEKDPNIWMPYNIGKAVSGGVDLSVAARYRTDVMKAGFSARYSFQDTKDMTPGSDSYGSQIPYVARHTVVLAGDASFKGWNLEAFWNLRSGRSDSYGGLPDWNTLDVTFSKTFRTGRKGLDSPSMTLSLAGCNLTDMRYELSRGYPMPGRSLIAGATFAF